MKRPSSSSISHDLLHNNIQASPHSAAQSPPRTFLISFDNTLMDFIYSNVMMELRSTNNLTIDIYSNSQSQSIKKCSSYMYCIFCICCMKYEIWSWKYTSVLWYMYALHAHKFFHFGKWNYLFLWRPLGLCKFYAQQTRKHALFIHCLLDARVCHPDLRRLAHSFSTAVLISFHSITNVWERDKGKKPTIWSYLANMTLVRGDLLVVGKCDWPFASLYHTVQGYSCPQRF